MTNSMVKTRLLGVLSAVMTLALDQAHKAYMEYVFFPAHAPPVKIGPYFDLMMAWNSGVSYSMFSAHTASGRFWLLAITLAATLALAVWLARVGKPMVAIGIGLLIGGALGNALDRFRFGAVADFFYFHIGGFSWYIFNIADCGIVAGVGLLLLDGLFFGDSKTQS